MYSLDFLGVVNVTVNSVAAAFIKPVFLEVVHLLGRWKRFPACFGCRFIDQVCHAALVARELDAVRRYLGVTVLQIRC